MSDIKHKLSILLVKINPDAFVRFNSFNPPTFCLVCAVISGAWKHDFTPRLACYVDNSIWANCGETIKKVIIVSVLTYFVRHQLSVFLYFMIPLW